MLITKKLLFITLAFFSLLNVTIQAQSFAYENGERAGKSELKKVFIQAAQSHTIQRSDFKEKRQLKTYPPEFLFFPIPDLTIVVVTTTTSKTFSQDSFYADFLSISMRPRAPPV